MPSFSGQSPATAADGISIQNVSGVLTQKSELLVGAVVTSDFTTTSGSLVDVTGMTITLASTNNVATKLRLGGVYSATGAVAVVLSLNTTATVDYTWRAGINLTTAGIARNGDMTFTSVSSDTQFFDLDGYASGTTSAVAVKMQAQIAGGNTLTIKVGSALRGTF